MNLFLKPPNELVAIHKYSLLFKIHLAGYALKRQKLSNFQLSVLNWI